MFKREIIVCGFQTVEIEVLLVLAGGKWYGINVFAEGIADTYAACVWEPSLVKINALTAASESCCVILSVDELIKHSKGNSEYEAPDTLPGPRGRGRPM